MRIVITGAGGFLGSNLTYEASRRRHDILGLVRSVPVSSEPGTRYETVDLLDPYATRNVITRFRPDAIVHAAILNDFDLLYANRKLAWDSYVGVTRTMTEAANEAGAQLVTVSTDWVFDGTQVGADERTPPNPVNYYGVLKAASELVTLERGREAAVARIAGVMGVHRARGPLPRGQDAGFGYFVPSLVAALERGEPFTVWESDAINMRATPSLASESSSLMLDLCERRLTGIYHCVGAQATTRTELARAATEVFELDPSLLRTGPPDPTALPLAPIPYDTSLDARTTSATLEVMLPDVRGLLMLFRAERAAG